MPVSSEPSHTIVSRWIAESAPVGHFTVLRALPTQAVQAVGPFVFLDHFGPFAASRETLPAHPHAGIEVMTYLMEGANEHRDSYGHRGIVEAGGAQWMRAGRGILHAETNLPQLGPTIHGLQIWARLPVARQADEPAYRAISASDVPHWTKASTDGALAEFRLLSGTCQGHTGPIPLAAPALLLHVRLSPSAHTELPLMPTFEYGVYGIAGELHTGNAAPTESLVRGDFAVVGGKTIQFCNKGSQVADILLLGGQAAQRPLYFGSPFVMDSLESLRQAKRDFLAGKMGSLDGVPH